MAIVTNIWIFCLGLFGAIFSFIGLIIFGCVISGFIKTFMKNNKK